MAQSEVKKSAYSRWLTGEETNLGSFHTLLFQAYRRADEDNTRKLETAFPEYFEARTRQALAHQN